MNGRLFVKNKLGEKYYTHSKYPIYIEEIEGWLEEYHQEKLRSLVIADDVQSLGLEANDEQGTPIVDEDGSMTCNCSQPEQTNFPNGKWICIKCWGEWYH